MRFVVRRFELWSQDLVIQAATPEEALAKAKADADYTIREDPRFVGPAENLPWPVFDESGNRVDEKEEEHGEAGQGP